MLRSHSRALWVVLCATLLPLFGLGLFAQEFSADFVRIGNDRSRSGPSKIFVGKDKMRMEGSERGQFGGGAMIIDFANQKTLMLMPAQKMYMESMPQMKMQEKNMLFRPDDPNNACPQYISLVKKHNPNENVTCRKVGEDTVNGRAAIKYAGTSNNGSGFVWIDPKLRFVVRWLDDKGDGTELRNIQEGTQDARLFEVPSDYHKFDMQQMERPRR
ncbi:MAG TPA: hypothetical protein VJP04_14485 [Terriglobales bacterium]|nr:hypothetical protein [Terriglobales bacterium]